MVVQFIVFLTLSTLICRGTDISKCFSESLGIRDNEIRLYFELILPLSRYFFVYFMDFFLFKTNSHVFTYTLGLS